MNPPLLVRCPTCRKTGPWLEGPYGPFCSKRCKLVDLGRWLGEEYRISEPLTVEKLAAAEAGENPADADAGTVPRPSAEEPS